MNNTTYLEVVKQIEEYEKKRKFCRHGLEHYLSVARIAYIMNLEQELHQDKEFIYLCALLHDIGRVYEYENGQPHELGGVVLAKKFLEEIDYPQEKRAEILKGIGEHRKEEDTLFWFADKRARNCFLCEAAADCNWKDEKRTKTIEW
ncbi:MAG: HD domain-containing protein [Lachnospiraceae bacterium]